MALVAFGCFLFIYNVSVMDMKHKAIPILGNLLAQLIGTLLFIIGIILSFVTSLKLGVFALVGSVVALALMSIMMFIERSIIQKKFAE